VVEVGNFGCGGKVEHQRDGSILRLSERKKVPALQTRKDGSTGTVFLIDFALTWTGRD